MDDSQENNGLPLGGESEASPSEPPATTSMSDGPISSEAAQTLPVPSNGSSSRKIEANRRNAQKSTGPKTSVGKTRSSWNSTRHGLLSKSLPRIYGQNKKRFTRLLISLRRDLEPVGTLEEVLVEKIAQAYWRLGVAAWHEEIEFYDGKPFYKQSIYALLRYQTTINRQLFEAINQLERLQRLRKGDNVPAPLNLQIVGEPPTILGEGNAER